MPLPSSSAARVPISGCLQRVRGKTFGLRARPAWSSSARSRPVRSGFLRVSGCVSAPVGMAMSERLAIIEPDQGLGGTAHQTAQLHAVPLATPRGSVVQAEGGTPPTPAAPFHCTLALPVFSISIDLPFSGSPSGAAGAVSWGGEKGSGVARLRPSAPSLRKSGRVERAVRVGDGELSVTSRGSRGPANMRTGGDHVNA
jgi:hypothetical protein